MTSRKDEKQHPAPKKGEGQTQAPPGAGASRRNLLKAGLTLGIVFVVGGAASVAKSLFSPANPPSPEAVQTTTPTVTRISTVTSTVTVGQSGSQSSSSSSSSEESSQSSSSSASSTSSTSTTSSPFPQVFIANVSDLVEGQPVEFNYPLEETPNILVKLGVKADGGVGPDGDIVAFSQVCQHLGCIVGYVAPKASPSCDNTFTATLPSAYCCCHGSSYDLTDAGAVTGGPAPRPIPQVTLQVDSSGDIYAIGMGPPSIFGHDTGSNNVLEDLQGGTLVSGS